MGGGGNVADAKQLMARAFEAFQVTLGCYLLMEFSIWVSRGGDQLEAPSSVGMSASLAHICKIHRLLYAKACSTKLTIHR